jgi:hypothetical protein
MVVERIGPIKNPLTIIAIFAAIAEISGTIVLPFIAPINQTVYVWFLMIFPILLILLFFLTLNFNHKVLYAPSDYKNEENFLHSLPRATFAEKVLKIEAELADESAVSSLIRPHEQLPKLGESLSSVNANFEAAFSSVAVGAAPVAVGEATVTGPDEVSTVTSSAIVHVEGVTGAINAATGLSVGVKAEAEKINNGPGLGDVSNSPVRGSQSHPSQRSVPRNAQATYMLAEELIFKKLSREFSSDIHREIKLGPGERFIFDGIVNDKGATTIIEVKVLRSTVNETKHLRETIGAIEESVNFFPIEQTRNLRLLFIFVTTGADSSPERITSLIDKYRSMSRFPIEVRCYNLDELKREAGLTPLS